MTTAHLRALEFADHEAAHASAFARLHYGAYDLEDGTAPRSIKQALDAYFDGDLDALDDIRDRHRRHAIPARRLARRCARFPPAPRSATANSPPTIGRAGASRAVGAANGANPIAIVVPCHRVIGANGTLTGYGSGLPRKRWLLDHEQRFAMPSSISKRSAS